MAQPINLRKPDRPIHVGVVLLNSRTELLDVAPVDILHGISKSFVDIFPDELIPREMKAQAVDIQFHWVSENGKAATGQLLTSNLPITPTDSFETCPLLDIVLVGAARPDYEPSEVELDFLRKSFGACAALLTVCAGMMAPLKAGIFEGKTATAPRFMLETFRRQAPGVNWVEKRWANDGKLWSSGALLNGLDLLKAFTEAYWGGEGSLIQLLGRLGSFPIRDIDYKDVPWKI